MGEKEEAIFKERERIFHFFYSSWVLYKGIFNSMWGGRFCIGLCRRGCDCMGCGMGGYYVCRGYLLLLLEEEGVVEAL